MAIDRIDGTPADLEVVAVLSESPRGEVLEVRRGEQPMVLRVELGVAPPAAALLGSLKIPGCAAPVESGSTDEGRVWTLRPMVPGRPFAEAAQSAEPHQLAAWVASLLETLGELHRAGFVHRDLKSDNVIVGPDGPVIVDLDLAVGAGRIEGAGTRGHVAPEVLVGQPCTPASDLFALGAMVAYACCGPPSPDFDHAFPRHAFWEASGLDPRLLPDTVSRLVRQLVRRHPGDRPSDAAHAASMLSGDATLPSLGLPFVGGRDAALRRLLSALEPTEGERQVVLVTVADPEETGELLDALHVGLAMGGKRVVRERFDEPLGPAIDRLASGDADCALVTASDEVGPRGLAELVSAYLTVPDAPPGVLGLVLGEDGGSEVAAAVGRLDLGGETVVLHRNPWPRVPVAALARHLDRLSGGAAPEVAQRLAASLHRLTIGRRTDLDRALSAAVRDGVLRADPPRYTLLRDEWPAEAVTAGAGATVGLRDLDEPSRAVLSALSVCEWPPTPDELAAILDIEPGAVLRALEGLAANRVVRRRHGSWGPVAVIDRRWTIAAHDDLAPEALAALQRAALEVCARSPERSTALALHRLQVAGGADDLGPVLDQAEALLDHARLGSARLLVQRSAPLAQGEMETRRRRIEARIELAQGLAERALASLQEHGGEGLPDADVETLLVAAHAAEQCGERELARSLNRRVLESATDRRTILRATVGLAYALLLDGDVEAAHAQADVPILADDDDAAAGSLLNLQGVIGTRRGGQVDPASRFEQAIRRAEAVGDPLLLARIELNRAHHDRRHGRVAEAVQALERAAGCFARAGHVQGRALALNNLGTLHRDRGELTTARERLREALALRRRLQDRHGESSSLGSLAAVELEAGHVGLAIEFCRTARPGFARGGHARELAFVDVHEAMALALAGRHMEAAERLAEQAMEGLRAENPCLVARAEALQRIVADDRAAAETLLSEALHLAGDRGDEAETFRCAALLLAVHPGDAAAEAAIHEAAESLDSPCRRAEAAWRTASEAEASEAERLERWLAEFDRHGRSDLVAAVARRLAESMDLVQDRAGRRMANARASHAGDALTDGLPTVDRVACLERIARTAGPKPTSLTRRRSLDVDWLLDCNRRLALEQDLEPLLLAIVDMALELTGSRRGFLVLMEDGETAAHVARNYSLEDVEPGEARFSRTVVAEAVASGRAVLASDACSDERFTAVQSVSSLSLRSVLCLPLPGVEGGGALYLDDDQRSSAFDDTDVERVAALADQAAVTINQLRRRREIEDLSARLRERVAYAEEELDQARSELRRRGRVAPVAGMVGDSEVMRRVFSLIDRVAPTSLNVLVTGPSGAGKDLVARALHERSGRADGPLVIENVAAVPANLLEAEMFGHARGAFTGADRERQGLFAEADGGTFLLDEIGELPLELQPKLLRVIESGEYRPVGSQRVRKVDVRIVAATNRDLLRLVREGGFREDLYYRLNAIEIRLPGLEERREDIPSLVRYTLDRLNREHGTTKTMTEEVLRAFVGRPWPGQVRELLNEVGRVYFLSDARIDDPGLVRVAAAAPEDGSHAAMPDSLTLEDAERAAIVRALEAADGKKERAARLLGISRAGLYAKIRRLDVDLG